MEIEEKEIIKEREEIKTELEQLEYMKANLVEKNIILDKTPQSTTHKRPFSSTKRSPTYIIYIYIY